jgi:hypothetical protein
MLSSATAEPQAHLIKSQKSNPMKTARSAIDSGADPRANRQRVKTKTSFLAAGLTAFLFVSSSIACSKTSISFSSESPTRIGSARLVKAIGGGSYVTGMAEPRFGYVPARAVHAHVAAYDANGKLLAEKTDTINHNDLVRWHLRPRPRAPYRVFFLTKPLKSPRSLHGHNDESDPTGPRPKPIVVI